MNSIKMLSEITVLIILSVFGAGCASSIRETKPITRKLASYHSLSVRVASSKPELKKYVADVTKNLVQQIKDSNLYDEVSTKKGGDLVLQAEIVAMSEGDAKLRAINLGGEAEVELNVELTSHEDSIGTFVAKGSSQRSSSVSVGGVNVSKISSLSDDLPNRAYQSAGRNIASFLKSKK
jgi:hypothetical protein